MAGIIPAMSPIIADIAVPINMFQGDNTKLKSPVNVDAKIDTIKTVSYTHLTLPTNREV